MMKDHVILSDARNHLADALKALLKAKVMGKADFQKSLGHAQRAVGALDALLRLTHRDAP